MRPPRKTKSGKATRPVPLSYARQNFSPLIEQLAKSPELEVPISVHGKVQAYLISAEHLAQLQAAESGAQYSARKPPQIRGTMKLIGDIDAALANAKKEHLRHLMSEVEEGA